MTKTTLIDIIKIVVYVLVFIFLVENVGIFRSIGLYLLFSLFVLLYQMYKYRSLLFKKMKEAETIIFSKPLDRDKWAPGEMKRTKIKMKWSKKNGQEKKV